MMRSPGPILITAALTVSLYAMPAAADDGRRHVMTPLQKIDLVRDLPDDATFERDGQYFDLGYIYPIHTVNGVSVASAGGEAGFVLYHDDKYALLSASDVRMLNDEMGEDATQGYTPPVPVSGASRADAADAWSANSDSSASRGQPLASSPARSSSGRRGGGTALGALFVFFVVLFLRVRLLRNLLVGGVLAGIAAIARRADERDVMPSTDRADDAFAAQAAAQRARLEGLSTTQAGMPGAPPRGFGRKVA